LAFGSHPALGLFLRVVPGEGKQRRADSPSAFVGIDCVQP